MYELCIIPSNIDCQNLVSAKISVTPLVAICSPLFTIPLASLVLIPVFIFCECAHVGSASARKWMLLIARSVVPNCVDCKVYETKQFSSGTETSKCAANNSPVQ